MNYLTASKARYKFFEIIKRIVTHHETYNIQHKQGNVVLMSFDDYENIKETLELLKTPGFKTSIQNSLKQIEDGEVFSFYHTFGD